MGLISRAPLVLRLWIFLSLLAVAFSAIALGTYTWLAISDDVDSQHAEVVNKVRVVQSSRFVMPSSEPLTYEKDLAGELGIRSLRLLSPASSDLVPPLFGALSARDAGAESALINSAQIDKPAMRRIRFDGDSFTATATTPVDVVKGGTFGE